MSDKALRRGWTTGACATAAARAALVALRTGRFPDPVTIRLPHGLSPSFALSRSALGPGTALAGVIKDAGDDPDVTHGAEIIAEISPAPPGSGIIFRAGPGVGTVTLPGLPLPPGEPAINPAPRRMICDNLSEDGAPPDVVVTLSIPGGAALAQRTLNPRLGIVGGLSVLGTTGVVVPYSCSAWIHSIQRGVDVARAAGLTHIAGATGRTSEAAVQRLLGLPEPALIDMGDFAGALLKYLRRHPLPRLTIAGGFAKIAKLAQGAMDLHSGRSQLDLDRLAAVLAELGAAPEVVVAARSANTGAEVLALAGPLPVAAAVAHRARETCRAVLAGAVAVDVAVFDRAGALLAHAGV